MHDFIYARVSFGVVSFNESPGSGLTFAGVLALQFSRLVLPYKSNELVADMFCGLHLKSRDFFAVDLCSQVRIWSHV